MGKCAMESGSAVLRAATSADIPAVVDTECRAFGRDSAEERLHAEQNLHRQWPEYMVLEERGVLVASAHVARHRLQVGRCSVLKGDVGYVAVLPEQQGRGLGTLLMRRLIPRMAAEGFHVSRLGGLMKFYARFGYEPFPRRFARVDAPRLDDVLKGQRWGDLLRLPPEQARRVRLCHPSRDHVAVHRLRYECGSRRSGQLAIRPEPGEAPAAGPDPAGLTWVYDDGEVRGYLRGRLGRVSAADATLRYQADELLFDGACPEAAGALVKTLIVRAQEMAPTKLICRFPFDEGIFAALTAASITFEIVELRQGADGNMIRVVNLPGALRAVEAELSDRLLALPWESWEGTVKLVLPEASAVLRVGADGVRAADDGPADVTLPASQSDLLKWLFGIAGFAEFPQAAGLAPGPRWALSCLFPRLACASGAWG